MTVQGRYNAALISLIVALALIFTFGRNTNVHNSDSLTAAFISINRVTWYYRDQNRFGNLLPFFAAWIRPIEANLIFQTFLRALTAVMSILFALEMLGERNHWLERLAIGTVVASNSRFLSSHSRLLSQQAAAFSSSDCWPIDRVIPSLPALRLHFSPLYCPFG